MSLRSELLLLQSKSKTSRATPFSTFDEGSAFVRPAPAHSHACHLVVADVCVQPAFMTELGL